MRDSEFSHGHNVFPAEVPMRAANATQLSAVRSKHRATTSRRCLIDGIASDGDLIDGGPIPKGESGSDRATGYGSSPDMSRWTSARAKRDLSSRPDDGDPGAECQRTRAGNTGSQPGSVRDVPCGGSAWPNRKTTDRWPNCDQDDYEATCATTATARRQAKTPRYQEVRRQHPKVERKLGELARWHKAAACPLSREF